MSKRIHRQIHKSFALVANQRIQIQNCNSFIRQKSTIAKKANHIQQANQSKSTSESSATPTSTSTPVSTSPSSSSSPSSSPSPSSASSSSEIQKKSFAVIGAGLSGLTYALHLARDLPRVKGKYRIVVYDSADRVGGWVKSDRIKPEGMEDGQGALLESGPRSFRMAGLGGLSTMQLIASLNLGDEVISVPKTAQSAYRRMIKYDNHFHILPHDYWSFVSTIWQGDSHVLNKAKLEDLKNTLTIGDRKSIKMKFPDESVESFFTRMLAPKNKDGSVKEKDPPPPALVEYLVSAMFHGIYAADISQLSMRSVLPQIYAGGLALYRDRTSWLPWPFNIRLRPLYSLEREGEEWAKTEYTKNKTHIAESSLFKDDLGKQITDLIQKMSVLSFSNGVQVLTDAIADECRRRGVEFRLNTKIERISMQEKEGKAVIKTKEGEQDEFNKVTCSLPSPVLDGLLSDIKLPNLSANPSTTVCVVNFAIPPKYKVRLPPAFGYLIPRASDKEGDNPFGHLGTVFDSEAVPGQDSYTKLTMMFGGPYWKPGYAMYDLMNATDLKEDKDELGIELASIILDPHLQDSGQSRSIIKNSDVIKRIQVQKDCIPTYTVGHFGRMDELHQALKRNNAAPLTVLGASYTGVSLNDCILHARRSAYRTILSEQRNDRVNLTGLEDYLID